MIQRTPRAVSTSFNDMSVDHGGFYIRMTKQLLDCANVGAALQQGRCKRMSHGMAGDPFQDLGFRRCLFDSLLDRALVDVMAMHKARPGILRQATGRKQILPTQFPLGIGIFAGQCLRKKNRAEPRIKIFSVDLFYFFELLL